MLKKLLFNSKGIILPPGAEVFNVAVETQNYRVGFGDDILNSSIQPNTFMGSKFQEFHCSDSGGLGIFPGTFLAFLDSQAPTQSMTVTRLDSQLTVKLEKLELLGTISYYSDHKIFSDDDIGKIIKVALIPS